MEITKVCVKCLTEKPLTSVYFAVAKQNKDGYRGECRECAKAYQQDYLSKNKDRLNVQKAEYRAAHKQEKAVTDKAYWENNVEKIAERRKKHYQEHRDEVASRVKIYRDNNLNKIREYREQNKEHISQRTHEYNERNRARIAERTIRYHQENAEKLREKRKALYAANREAQVQRSAAYRRDHPDKLKASYTRYAQNNPDKIHAKSALRRARFRNAYVETVSRAKVYERDGGICGLCGEKIELRFKAPHPQSLSLDHIIPLTKGGAHTYENAQVAHYGCNSRKGNRISN